MKRISFSVFLIMAVSLTWAQNASDAIRYSQNFYGGTARAMSMGNAFGSLGGEISSFAINPAGIGFNRSTVISITPSFESLRAQGTFSGVTKKDNDYNFNINNTGFISAYLSGSETGLVSINFGIAYNRLNNFSENSLVEGQNKNGSMIHYFQAVSQGKNPNSLYSYGERLAFDTYLIDTVSGGDGAGYVAAVAPQNSPDLDILQRRTYANSGRIGEWDFALGANISHKLYVGGNVGFQTIKYKSQTIHNETNQKKMPTEYDFDYFKYTERLVVDGNGVNFKMGLIARPFDWIRISAAVHTPTFINITEEYDSQIEASVHYVDDNGGEPNGKGYTFKEAFPSNENGTTLPPLSSKYEITSPFKAIGGLAFVIKNFGLVSAEAEFVDYSSTRVRSDSWEPTDINSDLSENYGQALNLRGGAEYKIGDFSIRGGYALYGKPHEKMSTRTVISGGLGFVADDFFMDLAYTHTTFSADRLFYELDPQITEPTPSFKYTNGQVLVTFGYKF